MYKDCTHNIKYIDRVTHLFYPYISDYESLFKPIITLVIEQYQPSAVVLQVMLLILDLPQVELNQSSKCPLKSILHVYLPEITSIKNTF
jgi:hypothetical protein